MKKLFILLILLAASFTPAFLYAQELTPVDTASREGTQSASPVISEASEDYALPYPGLLPDSPFYFLKAARDGIVGLLITNAAKKAEFNILQADKRLASAKALIEKDKKKHDLAISTLSKGENYLEEAILKTEEAKREGLETNELEKTLKKAVRKHKEVITVLHKNASGEEKKAIETVLKRVIKYEKEVNDLNTKNKDK